MLGDSKTAANGYPPKLLADLNALNPPHLWLESAPRIATGGWDAAGLQTGVAASIASVTPAPDFALVNIGVNDMNIMPTEAVFKGALQGTFDEIHNQFPLCQIYVMNVWRRNYVAEKATLNTWIDAQVAVNPFFVHAGPDERIFLENGDDGVTYTSDGVHPTEPAGYQLTADAWRAVLGY